MKDRKNTIIKPVVFNTEKHKNLLEFIENEGDFSKIVRELLIFAENNIKRKNVKLLDTLKEIYSTNKKKKLKLKKGEINFNYNYKIGMNAKEIISRKNDLENENDIIDFTNDREWVNDN